MTCTTERIRCGFRAFRRRQCRTLSESSTVMAFVAPSHKAQLCFRWIDPLDCGRSRAQRQRSQRQRNCAALLCSLSTVRFSFGARTGLQDVEAAERVLDRAVRDQLPCVRAVGRHDLQLLFEEYSGTGFSFHEGLAAYRLSQPVNGCAARIVYRLDCLVGDSLIALSDGQRRHCRRLWGATDVPRSRRYFPMAS